MRQLAPIRTIILTVILGLVMTGCDGGATGTSRPAGAATTRPTVSASPPKSEIRGCVPRCSAGFSDPGSIDPGPFTTTVFLDGHLTVTFGSRWQSHEDQGVEFSAAPAGNRGEGGVLFWVDILPWDQDGHVARGVSNTAAGWVAWLRSNPLVNVTAQGHATIGQMHLPATFVDVTDAPGGERFPDLITWPHAGGHVYGIAGTWVFRLYLADITYDDTDHLLAVAVEGTDAADLRGFLPEASQVVASADAPVEPS